jgi:hypothetical protein
VERKYSFLQAPFLSFSNTDLYRDVADQWKGSGALYIFLLSSVAWMISCLSLFVPFSQGLNDKTYLAIAEQIPGITIVDGKLKMDRPSPYDIKDPRTGISYIRFSADRDKEKMLVGDPALVVTQTALLISTKTISESKNSYKLTSYPDAAGNSDKDAEPAKVVLQFNKVSEVAPSFELDSKKFRSAVEKIVLSIPIAFMIIGWPFVFLGHLMELVLFGGITALTASMLQREMKFEKAMRLAAIAMTPGIIVSTILSSTKFAAPAINYANGVWWLGSIVMAIAYIVVIVRSLPEPQTAR